MTTRTWRRRLGAALLALLVATAAGCSPESPQTPQTLLKLMPLGDSITVGSNARGGYRINLWSEQVGTDGKAIDFVGSQNDGPAELDDADHEGHSGFRIDTVRAQVDGWLASDEPDVVLLLIGTNDVFQNYEFDTAPERLTDLVSRICTDRPGVHVAVGSIPPVPGQEPLVRAYNAAVPGVVETVRVTGCDVVFVDLNARLTEADIFNRHPTRAGYDTMAAAWSPAVDAFYTAAHR